MNAPASEPLRPVALVTGASSGTGRDIAIALAEDGCNVGLLGRRTAALEATAERIRALGREACVLTADVCDENSVSAVLEQFLVWSGGAVHVLVNAAGIPGPLGDNVGQLQLTDFDAVMATNLRGPFLTMSRLLPVMCGQGYGRVVNIGGTHGMRGRAGRASYATSKWALRGLTRSAALEVGAHGVTANVVAPGAIAVERMRQRWADQAVEEGVSESVVLERYVQAMGMALQRPNETADVVATVRFLVGEGGRNITGQEIVVDGGVIV
ncbi:SDR family NAD(P)-dependent oxidoreductase [Xylophilus rhododendri]|uniref:SDR family NAD(P)-dependent oxidoreductase n=1 Tax=Xylophilus rhododendri TaxID=2697032 RepID=A0A857J441_9BURK|nr:SDR family NAD(P)-dependent oxidoreductase [Xylophilus rhododendri]QHI97638.1 SDR family NAD(P)-dependent oxidoreductase [Xylophilus rhododendri]